MYKSDLRLQFGPGQKSYIKNWINIDANFLTAKVDVVTNLDWPLPFRDQSVLYAYSHHVVEHLKSVENHIKDVFRVLKAGGVYRIGIPNGDSAIKAFSNNELNWFSSFPKSWESIGGKLNNFLLCENEHLTILTESFLRELGEKAGFSRVIKCDKFQRTSFPEVFGVCLNYEENEEIELPHTLIVEFVK